MRSIAKGLAFLVFCVGAAAQQNTDTVWATIFNGYQGTLPATKLLTAACPSCQVGQTTHIFTGGLRNAPSHTCSTTAFILNVAVSEDGTNFFTPNGNASSVAVSLSAGSQYVYQTQARLNGSYPFIEAFINSFDTTNCVADVFYFGSKSSTSFTIVNFRSGWQHITTSGDTTLVANSTGNAMCIRGMNLWNLTAAQTVKITNGLAGSTIVGPFTNIPALTQVPLQIFTDESSTYACTTGANPIVINLANSTEVDVELFYFNQ